MHPTRLAKRKFLFITNNFSNKLFKLNNVFNVCFLLIIFDIIQLCCGTITTNIPTTTIKTTSTSLNNNHNYNNNNLRSSCTALHSIFEARGVNRSELLKDPITGKSSFFMILK